MQQETGWRKCCVKILSTKTCDHIFFGVQLYVEFISMERWLYAYYGFYFLVDLVLSYVDLHQFLNMILL